MKTPGEEIRKITLNLPARLLDDVLRESHKGLTETITELLRQEKNRQTWRAFSALRGSLKFDVTWQELRDKDGDRDLTKFLTAPPAPNE
jgi:hypothetical protein